MSRTSREQRQFERKSVALDASVRDGDTRASCQLCDISVSGARIRTAHMARAQTVVDLVIPGFGDFPCDVVRAQPPEYGLRFKDGPEKMSEVVAAIALLA